MAIPLRDDLHPRKIPFVTIAIIVLNTGIWLLWEPTFKVPQPEHIGPLGNQIEATTHDSFFLVNGAIPCEIVQRRPLVVKEVRAMLERNQQRACIPKQRLGSGGEFKPVFPDKKLWLSPIVSAFFHANLAHLFGNMLILLILGNNVEDKIGHLRYIALYAAGGAAAEFAHVASNPDSVTPAIGASGAISAVIGAFLVFFPFARVLTLVAFPVPLAVYLPAFAPILFWFAIQFTPVVGSNIAVWAHIGGFFAGVILGPTLYATIRPRKLPPLARGPVWVNTRPVMRG